MAETYYQDMIPEQCTSGDYNAGSSTVAVTSPVVDITVYEDGATTSNTYKIYSDQFNYPLLRTTYNAGTVFRIAVKYTWFNNDAKDYTVSVYSKQDLQIKDSTGKGKVVNYDGSAPSGFTSSTFDGMENTCGADPFAQKCTEF